MAKDSFILYKDQKEIFDNLSDEQAGILIKAIFEYEGNGFDNLGKLTPLLNMAFIPIKQALDRNSEKYQNKCEANKQNGLKGGRPKNPNNPDGFKENRSKPKKADNEHDSDNDNDNEHDNDSDNIPASEAKPSTASAKASKHKYGEYKNVLLKDEELQSLKKEYGNWNELIRYLDEYIEMKGYKAKSHYLCIKKWVTDAVNKNKNASGLEDWING